MPHSTYGFAESGDLTPPEETISRHLGSRQKCRLYVVMLFIEKDYGNI